MRLFQFSSVQFKMLSMRLENPVCAPSCLSEVSPTLPLKRFQCSFNASLLQAIDGVMSLALCPQVMPQVSQHFRSSEKQATCDGCFARQSICSVVSLHSGMSRAERPQEFSKVDVDSS